MVQISTLVAAAVLGFLSVSASPVAQDAALDGRDIGPTMWRGVLEEGKEMVYLTGSSYDDIEAQAKALNPAFSIYGQNTTAEQEPTSGLDARDLSGRAVTSVNCGWPGSYKPAPDYFAASTQVSYLSNLKGDCAAPAGPARCARAACSRNSAIYFCNDNKKAIWQPCAWVGQTANKVFKKCGVLFDGSAGHCHGQAFVDRNWNVIIAKGNC